MRIAIVNDLALAREVLRRLIESVPGYSVSWTAVDGAEAVQRATADSPDVILMDLVMPVMDGAEATRRIMANSPCPILIVTASVGGNFDKVYEALGAGGLDAVKTPTFGPDGQICGGERLLARLAKILRARRLPETKMESSPASNPDSSTARSGVVALPQLLAIGASTGGPEAVAQVLTNQSPPGPVIVVQHIGLDFAAGFATWLQSRTGLPTSSAVEGTTMQSGHVYIAKSNDHLIVRPDKTLAYTADPKSYVYRPSVDVLFESLITSWPRPGVAVLLTGMGSDGARGLAGLRQQGWHTIAQDQSTSVVYGMPKAAAELNAAVQILPLPAIAAAIRTRLQGSSADAVSRG